MPAAAASRIVSTVVSGATLESHLISTTNTIAPRNCKRYTATCSNKAQTNLIAFKMRLLRKWHPVLFTSR